MKLKVLPTSIKNEAMIDGLTYKGGGIYPIQEVARVVKCVNFFRAIPDQRLDLVMQELRDYFSGVEHVRPATETVDSGA